MTLYVGNMKEAVVVQLMKQALLHNMALGKTSINTKPLRPLIGKKKFLVVRQNTKTTTLLSMVEITIRVII